MLTDGQTTDQALKTLQQINLNRTDGDKQPFFLATGFHKPHLPFFAPSKYYDMHPPADQIKPPANLDPPKYMPPIAFEPSLEIKRCSDITK